MWNELKTAFVEHPVKLACGFVAGFTLHGLGPIWATAATLAAYTTAHILIRSVKGFFAS